MIRKLRRFNDEGLRAADRALDAIDRDGDAPIEELLTDPKLTESMEIDIEVQPFVDRFEAAAYLVTSLKDLEDVDRDIASDPRLWTWLALAWLDLLAPVVLGKRKLGARSRWVLAADDYSRYYRHLLASPYRIYQTHADDPQRARALLATDVTKPGDVFEQIASRQALVVSPGVMQVITDLYVDPVSGALKKGAASKTRGSARRFAALMQQLDLTYDFYEMASDQILALLPEEFDRFR